MVEKRKTSCKTDQEPEKRFKHRVKHVTCFKDLPNEILLMICRYMSPANVIEAFWHYDKRLFSCISEYRENIDLSKCSFSDLECLLIIFVGNHLKPSTLTLSNARIPTQIEIFVEKCNSSINFHPDNVHHLSLLECTDISRNTISSCLNKFKSLQSLHFTQSTSVESKTFMDYSFSQLFRDMMSKNSFKTLTELELTSNDGIILDKQLCSNNNLKKLTISLENIDDLYVLFDDLMSNLILLNVTVCQSIVSKRSTLPPPWPCEPMSHLIEFQLITNENVPLTFDQFRSIVMPLPQLNKLTLIVNKWISDDQRFIEGNQLEMLIQQFLPQLHHFYCSIKTMDDIDMQTFAKLNERWPMKCRSNSNNLQKHLYTVPWSFKHLDASMLADDDTSSVCPNVQYLTIDVPCPDPHRRFPNIHTSTLLPGCDLSHDNCLGFRRLRHLIMTNINMVPSFVTQRIHTLTLFEINEVLKYSIIYSNVQHLIVKNSPISSTAILIDFVKHFPNLLSLEIQLQPNTEYYDSLDILLGYDYLSELYLIKINWIENKTYRSDINLWMASKTLFKWMLTPFYAHCHRNHLLTIAV